MVALLRTNMFSTGSESRTRSHGYKPQERILVGHQEGILDGQGGLAVEPREGSGGFFHTGDLQAEAWPSPAGDAIGGLVQGGEMTM